MFCDDEWTSQNISTYKCRPGFWKLIPVHSEQRRYSGQWLPNLDKKKSSIHYLHNTIMHLFNPPKILHTHCLQFLLGHEHVPRVIWNNTYANFWGVKEVYYGICASGEYKSDILQPSQKCSKMYGTGPQYKWNPDVIKNPSKTKEC